ncbi:Hypothetical protein NAEGRDRAFT_73109 [Naegleria gruberi]|uniref:F-box domain-containing protein n=1 Tax=Naegleria gruberi TaxID=5762 RepID=D2VVQ9_NAEGR|nr:uncharacterized protein NAEGRDRAFT_73109 [Naegleria gruberi]EFC39149.1 Hypothetical protein NAEGRDRAFT_73109 [Naegleria gruberi]|eukprot:XP_002671893.1 Hypothetical protein NAEGRDRAFT_73109 [Naegleria gruberi strain NEG-M]
MKRQLKEESTKGAKKTKRDEMNMNEMIELAMTDQVLVFGSESATLSSIKLNNVECPQEILSLILDYANVEALQNIKLVSKSFYDLSVMDKRYEKAMMEEFPLYSRRLKHLNEFNGLVMKLLKRRFVTKNDDERLERLFWWIVGKSEGKCDNVEKIIVDNSLVDIAARIETKFYKVLDHLVSIGRDNDMDDFEDDGGMYAVCKIISEGEEYYNKICADPESGAESEGYENYMYPFNRTTYIPEDYSESELEEVYEALASGYKAFKELNL